MTEKYLSDIRAQNADVGDGAARSDNAMEENLREVFAEISGGNDRGEKITLVGATKTVDAAKIERAIKLGLKIIGDNKVQEFRDKSSSIDGAEFHFIGRLQKNKVKYLVGKVSLIQSVDDYELAAEIDRRSKALKIISDILVEINVGGEQSKGGFALDKAREQIASIAELKSLRVKGLMAMLPKSDDEEELASLCRKARGLYDELKASGLPFEHLSMGMSGDYTTAIKNGSNMIRLGTRIFGARTYTTEVK